jgi:hypothetical protein
MSAECPHRCPNVRFRSNVRKMSAKNANSLQKCPKKCPNVRMSACSRSASHSMFTRGLQPMSAKCPHVREMSACPHACDQHPTQCLQGDCNQCPRNVRMSECPHVRMPAISIPLNVYKGIATNVREMSACPRNVRMSAKCPHVREMSACPRNVRMSETNVRPLVASSQLGPFSAMPANTRFASRER